VRRRLAPALGQRNPRGASKPMMKISPWRSASCSSRSAAWTRIADPPMSSAVRSAARSDLTLPQSFSTSGDRPRHRVALGEVSSTCRCDDASRSSAVHRRRNLFGREISLLGMAASACEAPRTRPACAMSADKEVAPRAPGTPLVASNRCRRHSGRDRRRHGPAIALIGDRYEPVRDAARCIDKFNGRAGQARWQSPRRR